jgi:hypothetical protein
MAWAGNVPACLPDAAPPGAIGPTCLTHPKTLNPAPPDRSWTRQAVLGNQENVVITDNPFLLGQFYQQFEKLWAMFRA